MKPVSLLVLLVALLGIPGTLSAETIKSAQALPNAWGPQYPLTAHLGSTTYTVKYRVLGKTVVVGQVEFYDEKEQLVTKEFKDSITFRTGNVAATPRVRFKGIPLGSAVDVIY